MDELLELADKFKKGDTKGLADLTQFEQVQPTCSGLVVADECLRFTECACHVNLAKTGLHPELAEQGQEGFLLLPVRRKPRAAFFHSASSIEMS